MAFVEWIRVGKEGVIAEIILNRPEARNAFTTEMAEEILKICNEINDSDIRAVLITSSNEKSFCSGADLKERNGMTETTEAVCISNQTAVFSVSVIRPR